MCSNENNRLADEITELASHIHAATCRWLGLVAEHADDGSLLLHARLPAEEGAVVLAALEAGVERLRERASAESPSLVPASAEAPALEPASADPPALVDAASAGAPAVDSAAA